VQVGDLIKCIDGGLYIAIAITEETWKSTTGEVVTSGVTRYADLIDAVTLDLGACLRVDDNPYYEIVSSRDS